MEVEHLKRRLTDLTWDLLRQEFLDDQFRRVQSLEENNPGFPHELVTLFIQDSTTIISELSVQLDEESVNFGKVSGLILQLTGCTASIGASRVNKACLLFGKCAEEENKQGCRINLQHVKEEHNLLTTKLEALLKLEQQIAEASISKKRKMFCG